MKNCYDMSFKGIGNKEVGFLLPVEQNCDVPFTIKRIYYLYDVPLNIRRGYHAHKKLEQVLICLKGKVKIQVYDGNVEKVIVLDKPTKGLYIGPFVWREMFDFEDAVLLVIASDFYSESDYIRDYKQFLILS